MSLSAGTRLEPSEALAALAGGGTGEVYSVRERCGPMQAVLAPEVFSRSVT